MKFWNLKTFLLITGAAKGLGKTCAIEFSKNVAPGSMSLLLSRSMGGLEATKKIITSGSVPVKVQSCIQDLRKPDGVALEAKILEFLGENGAKPSDFDHAIIVHGTNVLGDLNIRALKIQDVDDLQQYFCVNAFAPVVLNSHFMNIFQDDNKMRTILNMTSDAALRPYNSLSYYCAASMARESFMCVTGREEPSVLVLNYNPGPLDIHMATLEQSSEKDLKEYCAELKNSGQIITCEQSVEKLIKVLKGRSFFSGEHVEYSELK